MKIIYSKHARLRMLERAITESRVEEVVASPDFVLEEPKGRLRYSKKTDGKLYSVVLKEEGDKLIVITVF